MTSGPWYVEAFGPLYPDVYRHRDEKSAEREAAFAVRALALAGGDRVLDLACGAGRHARALRRRGLEVVGLDLSPTLLDAARTSGGGPRYVRGDMRDLPFRPGFDAVTMFFTSFGYFAEEAEDAAALAQAARVLGSGGRLLIDFANREEVIRTLVPRSEEERAGRRIVQVRGLTPDRRRVEKRVEIREAGGEIVASWTESVRLYSPDELTGMLQDAGLDPTGRFGDLAGSPHGPGSPRLVLVAGRGGGAARC